MPRTCRVCGCTDTTPCVTDGQACAWAGPELCTTCADHVSTVVDARIVDVAILAGGRLETTIEGTLDDGRRFEGVWPGEWSLVPPSHHEESP